jgi:hypothetical protein
MKSTQPILAFSPSTVVMLARTARQATRAAHRPTKQNAARAPRLARSYATPASASGPHERASGFNSAAAGAGVFGATVLLGYVMGVLGDHSRRDAALKKLGESERRLPR